MLLHSLTFYPTFVCSGTASAIWVTRWLALFQKSECVPISQWDLQRWLPPKPSPGPDASLLGPRKGTTKCIIKVNHKFDLSWDVPWNGYEPQLLSLYPNVCVFSQGVFGSRSLQLPPLHAGSHRWQRLGLCLSLPSDHLFLVQAARLRRQICAHSQGDPTGTGLVL